MGSEVEAVAPTRYAQQTQGNEPLPVVAAAGASDGADRLSAELASDGQSEAAAAAAAAAAATEDSSPGPDLSARLRESSAGSMSVATSSYPGTPSRHGSIGGNIAADANFGGLSLDSEVQISASQRINGGDGGGFDNTTRIPEDVAASSARTAVSAAAAAASAAIAGTARYGAAANADAGASAPAGAKSGVGAGVGAGARAGAGPREGGGGGFVSVGEFSGGPGGIPRLRVRGGEGGCTLAVLPLHDFHRAVGFQLGIQAAAMRLSSGYQVYLNSQPQILNPKP